MDTHQITDLVASVSALMERFERRTQQIEDSLQTAHRQLQDLSRQLPETLRRSTDTEMRHLRDSVASTVDAGLGHSVSTFQTRLETAAQDVRQASHALAAQLHAARALYRHLLWKIVGVCLASLALVVLGGGWLSRHYYEEIRRHQVSAQLLQAYDAADVTLCDGRLCANIDPKGDRFGEDDQYRPVRDRR
jgi:hypothetical protein